LCGIIEINDVAKGVEKMFEVYELTTGDCYMVYGVAPVLSLAGEKLGTDFLFYKKGQWVWENADHYEAKL
jgi:hypothetical protein